MQSFSPPTPLFLHLTIEQAERKVRKTAAVLTYCCEPGEQALFGIQGHKEEIINLPPLPGLFQAKHKTPTDAHSTSYKDTRRKQDSWTRGRGWESGHYWTSSGAGRSSPVRPQWAPSEASGRGAPQPGPGAVESDGHADCHALAVGHDLAGPGKQELAQLLAEAVVQPGVNEGVVASGAHGEPVAEQLH